MSAGYPLQNAAYISRTTGRIYWVTDAVDSDEELPDDLEDGISYRRVPHKNDLDLGQALVFRFVSEQLPDCYEQVRKIFDHKGAYGRFKQLVERTGRLQARHDFRQAATEEALREWAAAQGVEVVDEARDAG